MRALKPLRFEAVDLLEQIASARERGGKGVGRLRAVTHALLHGSGGGSGRQKEMSSDPRRRLLRIRQVGARPALQICNLATHNSPSLLPHLPPSKTPFDRRRSLA